MNPQINTESKGISLLRDLFSRGKRVFDMQDINEIAQIQKIPPHQLRKILSSLAKRGLLLRIRRGLYVAIGLIPEQTNTDPFVISSFLIRGSVISHWSALQYHGLTEQIPQTITASTIKKITTPSMHEAKIMSSNIKHAWVIDDIRYEYIHVQDKNLKLGEGVEKIWINEFYSVLITDKERTILDVFINPKMFGGMGEALGVLENVLSSESIDVDKLVRYAVAYEKKYLAKRLGWALESFGIKAKALKPLLDVKISHYTRLDPSSPATGACDKHWMVQNNLITKAAK